jgi:predicted kinase
MQLVTIPQPIDTEGSLILIRGLMGSGKSTLARKIVDEFGGGFCDYKAFAADDYMVDEDGSYKFDSKALGRCHGKCQMDVAAHIRNGGTAIVHNTFIHLWEMNEYVHIARDNNVALYIIDLFDNGLTDAQLAARNEHGVTAEMIAEKRKSYYHEKMSLSINSNRMYLNVEI